LKILRPPIGDFDEGKLYAIAISPDGKTVAVGGFTGANHSENHPIYIFDRESGTIRKTITGLPDATNHLAYSKDGRLLAASPGGTEFAFTKLGAIPRSPAMRNTGTALFGSNLTSRADW
jgi:WD40 repeat protein